MKLTALETECILSDIKIICASHSNCIDCPYKEYNGECGVCNILRELHPGDPCSWDTDYGVPDIEQVKAISESSDEKVLKIAKKIIHRENCDN